MSETAKGIATHRLGLYYPYIHFRDVEWLKMAVLYWEGLARIVPSYYSPHDSPEVKNLQDASPTFLRDQSPDDRVLRAASEPFLGLLDTHGDELRQRFGARAGADDLVDAVPHGVDILGPKLYPRFKDGLEEAGLADIRKDPSGLDAAYVHPKLADAYMAALASEMARASQLHPVTDQPTPHLGMSGLTVDRLAQALLDLEPPPVSDREYESAMALFSLRMVLPKGLNEVSFPRLVAFRRDHSDELSAYQDFIAELTAPGGDLDGLGAIEDPGALEAHMSAAYRRSVEPKMKDLEKALHGIGVETVHSVATVTVKPIARLAEVGVGAAVGVALAGGIAIAPLFAAASIGLAVFRVARRHEFEAKRVVHDSPAAYLMYAREELTTRGAMDQLTTSARRFAIAH